MQVLQASCSAVALLVLLVVAFTHPRPWVEAVAGVLCAGVVLLTGAVGPAGAGDEVDRLLPVVLFLVVSLVLAEACARLGVFGYLGAVVSDAGAGDGRRLLVVTAVVAAVVTAVLSLDATVVMLTPVLVAAAPGVTARPLAHLSGRLANSASLLLPVSNLTNLLVQPRTSLGFVGWATAMVLPWSVVVAVEHAGVRSLLRRDLTAPARTASRPGGPAPSYALVVVGSMLVGFVVATPLGVEPWTVAGVAAVALVVRARGRGAMSLASAARSAQVPFGIFVLALGVVVAAASRTFLGDPLARLVHAARSSVAVHAVAPERLGGLLLLAVVAMLLANLVNNLPATLLLLPLVAPLGTTAVLAVVIGVDVGAGLTYTGSLANLLWRRVLTASGEPPSTWTFHRLGLLVTPVALVAAVVVLWLEAPLMGLG